MCLTFTYCHLLAPAAVYAKRADPLLGLIFLMNELVLAFTNCLAQTTFLQTLVSHLLDFFRHRR